jgi:hypothetical protein
MAFDHLLATSPLESFTWPVDETGYHWVKGQGKDSELRDEFLVPAAEDEDALSRVTYPLRDAPALHRTFADLDGQKATIAEFASKHGMLGVGEDWRDQRGKVRPYSLGETLSFWRSAILDLREAIELADAIRAEDHRRLKEWIHLDEGREVYVRPRSSQPSFVNQVQARDNWETGRLTDPWQNERVARVMRARIALGKIVNEHLQGWLNRQLPRLSGGTMMRMVYVPDRRTLERRVSAGSLLGALWLQLTETIDTPAEPRTCLFCKSWFLIERENEKRARKWCSNACKQKAKRARASEPGPVARGRSRKRSRRRA